MGIWWTDGTTPNSYPLSGRRVACARRPNRIGRLVLTQATKSKKPEPKIREPEMLHAMAQEAERRKTIFYGIEAPTKGSFRFTLAPGERRTTARHDFVVLNGRRRSSERMNLLELKKDQPDTIGPDDNKDCPKVRKDFQELIVELAGDGKAMLHILHERVIKRPWLRC